VDASIVLNETSLTVVFWGVGAILGQQLVKIDLNVESVKDKYRFRGKYAARLLDALLPHLEIKLKEVETTLEKWSEMQRRSVPLSANR